MMMFGPDSANNYNKVFFFFQLIIGNIYMSTDIMWSSIWWEKQQLKYGLLSEVAGTTDQCNILSMVVI